MRPVYALGMMSGTSADGVSCAVARIREDSIEPVLYAEFQYPRHVQQYLLGLHPSSARDISRANFVIGELFAEAAVRTLKKSKVPVDFIGSHGQTIVHQPEDDPPNTLQLGEASIIAQRTGLTTVADFRPADMAAGGQAAPLTPYFDHFVFSGRAPIALQNIGGIGNVTIVERSIDRTYAFDTGPGNCLMDEMASLLTNGKLGYDPEGQFAAQGRVDVKLLDRFLDHPFLRKRPPKSACRTDFVPDFLRKAAGKLIERAPLDVIATATLATARTVADSIPKRVQEVIVSGGGVYNRTLMKHLESMMFPVPVRSVEAYGWHPLAKEPACFALLAYETLRGRPANVPSATGARQAVVLGKIAAGRNFRAVMRKLGR